MENNFGRKLRIVVFAYDFPHMKSTLGLLALCAYGSLYRPDLVLLQKKKELKHHQSILRYSPRYKYIPDTKNVCISLDLPYMMYDYDKMMNSLGDSYLSEREGVDFMIRCDNSLGKEPEPDIGIVLGARILPMALIQKFSMGIINMHPGLLPENRGLDNHKWAILDHIKQGVTLHFIDENIDEGYVFRRMPIEVHKDDSLVDIHLRLQDYERGLLLEAMKSFYYRGTWGSYKSWKKGKYNKAMTTQEDARVLQHFKFYKQYYDHMHE